MTHRKDIKHAASLAQVRAALLPWFRENARDLPWRRSRDPYAIWVSEVMLQQTRVDTVIPYYQRFLSAFPSVLALSDAPLSRVLEAWSGLGYYRRARLLHRGAQTVASTFAGKVPDEVETLLHVPGVGDYTAGAIASIAYGKSAALVDGNVHRVLSRLFGLSQSHAEVRKQAWAIARELIPGESPGDLNQALMELGATVCTPKAAQCARCPVSKLCVAYAQDKVDVWPIAAKKKAVPTANVQAFVVTNSKDEVLLAQRPEEGRFGGLWEPPILAHAPSFARSLTQVAHLTHILSQERMEVSVFRGATRARKPPALTGYAQTVFTAAPETLALSTLARKILAWR
jgi:A/G-specific adenine glycosylase